MGSNLDNIGTTETNNTTPSPTVSTQSAINTIDSYWQTQQEKTSGKQNFYTITHPSQHAEIEHNKKLFFERIEELGMQTDEIRPILEGEGHKLIVSGAGAGKTTVITLKELYDFATGRKLKRYVETLPDGSTQEMYMTKRTMVSTFLSSGAIDIKETFVDWAQKLGIGLAPINYIRFSTLHSEVLAALKGMGLHVKILENSQVTEIVKAIMLRFNIRNKGSYSAKPTVDEVREVESILAYTRNVLDAKRYTHHLTVDYALDKFMIDEVLEQMKLMKQSLGGMDFEDLQEELLSALNINQNVVNYIVSRYDSIVVDEFQDTSQLQYGYLLYYFAGFKDVTVVGDDDQIIYSFRGSDPNIILHQFIEDMKPTIYHLTRNFRCGQVILEAVIPSITKNRNRFEKQLRAANKGGEINILYSVNAEQITSDITKYLTKGWTTGIISRLNDELIMPAIILELEGKVDYAVSKGVSMKRGVPKQLVGLMDLLTKRYTEEFVTLFKSLLPFKLQKQAIALDRILKINTDMSLKNISEEDLKNSAPDLHRILQPLRTFMLADEPVKGYLYLLTYLRENVFTQDKRYHIAAVEFIEYLISLITTHPRLSKMDMFELNTLFTQELPAKIDRRIKYSGEAKVFLTTVHEAKGKEWDAVYIWNDIENVFPTKLSRPLTDEEFEEERRMHYIAWTRAKKVLNVVTRQGRESVFLKECDLSMAGIPFNGEDVETKNIPLQRKNSSTSTAFNTARVVNNYHEEINLLDSSSSEHINYHIVRNALPDIEDLVEYVKKNYGIRLLNISQKGLEPALEHKALTDELHYVFYEIANAIYSGSFK